MRPNIITAFGPGRPWTFDLWQQTVLGLRLPLRELRFSCVVNGDARLYERVSRWLGTRAGHYSLRYVDEFPDRKAGARIIAGHIAGIYNRMIEGLDPAAEWVLCIEPDVLPAFGDFERLAVPAKPGAKPGTASPARRGGCPQVSEDAPVGIIGCAICSRWSGHVMAYRAKSLDPWRLDRRPVKAEGAADVDSVSLGFTLIRAELLRGFAFTATPNADGTGGNGHEWSLMKRARLDGWRVLCDFGVRPRHYTVAGKYVVA